MKKSELVNEFNAITSGLLTFISKFYDVGFDISHEFDVLKKDYPEEPITNFITHICKNNAYRNGILGNNVDFIMYIDSSFDIIFSLVLTKIKDIWNTLEHESKLYIIKCLRVMIKISDIYMTHKSV